MRLIDSDALRQAMYHEAFEVDSDMQKWDSGCWIRYKMFENAIDNAPTIEPVKRGKWIRERRPCIFSQTGSADWLTCSVCGERFSTTEVNKEKYCRNCGAKMEGSEE